MNTITVQDLCGVCIKYSENCKKIQIGGIFL